MKKHLKKLTLSRETLHLLDGANLEQAKGGVYTLRDATCSINACYTVDVCPPNSNNPRVCV